MRLHDTEKLMKAGAKVEKKAEDFYVRLFGKDYMFSKMYGEDWRFAIYYDRELIAITRSFDTQLVVATPSGGEMMGMCGSEVTKLTDESRCLIVAELIDRWFEK